MDFFKVTPFEAAKAAVKEIFRADKLGTEVLPLSKALFRRAAKDVISTEELPEYNRSTVDGYAVRAANTYGATDGIPSMLKLVGRVEMGVVGGFTVGAGEAVYVPTGGAVPDGADAMVMLEYAEVFDSSVAIYRPTNVGENIIRIGDDIKKGEVILRKGAVVSPLVGGVLASVGVGSLEVYKRVKAAIISTGDEIVGIEDKTQIGQIRDANTTINAALCKENGFEVVSEVRIKDGFDYLKDAVLSAVDTADIVLISGGSSIGVRDYTEQVLSSEGNILVHGVAIKPGKPTLIARVGGKAVLGLPGHPMACLLTLKLLVLNSVNEQFGDGEAPFVFANTTVNFPSAPGRLTVQPMALKYTAEGIEATPLFYKSGLVSVLSRADGYTLVSSEQEGVAKGQSLKVYLL